jgi:hypothetical protein
MAFLQTGHAPRKVFAPIIPDREGKHASQMVDSDPILVVVHKIVSVSLRVR